MEDRSDARTASPRARQQQWRDRLPEIERLVEDVGPRIWSSTEEDRIANVPVEWKTLVSAMRDEVHADAEAANYHDDDMTVDERRGYHWTWKVMRVGDMLEHLTRTIREDLGFDDGATLASIVLLRKAALYLQLELNLFIMQTFDLTSPL